MRVGSPTVLLYAFLILTQLISGLYFASGIEPPPSFEVLYPYSFLWIIGWWLQTDTKKRGVSWVYDMGLFLYFAWPLIMLHYLVDTRGVKGLLQIAAFIGVYIGALIIGIGLYLSFAPTDWPRW